MKEHILLKDAKKHEGAGGTPDAAAAVGLAPPSGHAARGIVQLALYAAGLRHVCSF